MTKRNRKNIIHCGIIYGDESMSGKSKVTFGKDSLKIDGGLLHDVTYEIAYREIDRVCYSAIVPKVRFMLKNDGREFPKLSVYHWQLRQILRMLQKHQVTAERRSFSPNPANWFRFWYSYQS